tara:strand:- start:740 stop:871 length:132 start_codon:yes stop_codon:yes gene_type:complete
MARRPGPVGINVHGGGAMIDGTSQADGVVPLNGDAARFGFWLE